MAGLLLISLGGSSIRMAYWSTQTFSIDENVWVGEVWIERRWIKIT